MRPSFAVSAALAAFLALAAPTAARAREAPARWRSWSVELVDEAGRVLPTFRHRGRTYVLGELGQRYLVRVTNGSATRAEVVVSVDGRDVVDGRPASLERRGYVVEAHGQVTIDGYRLSESSVAAFRFGSVPRSYAARKGDARDVGVIGVAVFPERAPEVARPLARAEASEAAPSPPAAAGRAARARPGLGTEFGEEHESRVRRVSFQRASPRPEAILTLRYDDRPELVALGIDVDGDRLARADDRRLRETAEPFRGSHWCEPPTGWRPR